MYSLHRIVLQQGKKHISPLRSARLCAGFSLTEMLATMLILVLVATLVATGVPTAIDAYTKTVKAANAQVALSTSAAVLRSELGMANRIIIVGDNVYYLSEGVWKSIMNYGPIDELGHGLQKSYYSGNADYDDITSLVKYGDSSEIVPSSALTNELRVEYNKVAIDTRMITFEDLCVVDGAENKLASIEHYSIATPFNG